MLPLTIQAAQKLADLLASPNGIEAEVSLVGSLAGRSIAALPATQVFVTSTSTSMADVQQQLGYPRVTVFSNRLRNQQIEKFRSLSGVVTVIAEISATADLVDQVESAIHFYVEAAGNLLRRNIGDWGDGVFFPGAYDVDVQAPTTGASGFLQLARITCELKVSRN
jgi:hypothetical protein